MNAAIQLMQIFPDYSVPITRQATYFKPLPTPFWLKIATLLCDGSI